MSILSSVYQKTPNFSEEARPTVIQENSIASNPVRAAQSEGEPIRICGYVKKRGGAMTNPAYKLRWIVVTHLGNVRYFAGDTITKKSGDFSLIRESVAIHAAGHDVLYIVTPDRTWDLQFESEEVRAKWIYALQEVIHQAPMWNAFVGGQDKLLQTILRQALSGDSSNTSRTKCSAGSKLLSNIVSGVSGAIRSSSITAVRATSFASTGLYDSADDKNTMQRMLELQCREATHQSAPLDTAIVKMVQIGDYANQIAYALKVCVLSWNLQEYLPDMVELSFLKEYRSCDVFVVGVQECQPPFFANTANIFGIRKTSAPSTSASLGLETDDQENEQLTPVLVWKALVQNILGKTFVLVAGKTMGAIQILVFSKMTIVSAISNVAVTHVPCGVGNVMYNKGAAAVSMKIYDKSFVFVCAHLPSHQDNIVKRNKAYQRINNALANKLISFNNSKRRMMNIASVGGTFSNNYLNGGSRRPSVLSPTTSSVASSILPSPRKDSSAFDNGDDDNGFSSSSTVINGPSIAQSFDYTFFFGDLNYRINYSDFRKFVQLINIAEIVENKSYLEHQRKAREEAAQMNEHVVNDSAAGSIVSASGAGSSGVNKAHDDGVLRESLSPIAALLQFGRKQLNNKTDDNTEDDEEEVDANDKNTEEFSATAETTTTVEDDDALIQKFEMMRMGGHENSNSIASAPAQHRSSKRISVWKIQGELQQTSSSSNETANTRIFMDIINQLFKNDQLSIARNKGLIFQGYTEGPIAFKPSYKFANNTNTYDTTKNMNRTPAWCDRILYHCLQSNNMSSTDNSTNSPAIDVVSSTDLNSLNKAAVTNFIKMISYECIHGVFYSDHRPVVGIYEVHV